MRQWTVADVMSKNVVTVRADTPYAQIVSTLAKNNVGAVPVVDKYHRVLGVVSEADLLHKVEFLGDDAEHRTFERGTRKINRAKAHAATAADLMTSPAVTIMPGMSVTSAAKVLESEQVKRLPVIDELDRLVGIVSRSDLLSMYLRSDNELCDDAAQAVRRLLWTDPVTIEVEVHDGVVTLSGHVERKTTANLAGFITKTIPGVVEVIDRVEWTYDDTSVTPAVM